ncbi:hypothetical protein JCM14469_16170 [Desulfatiferula olefinivorans]
MPKTLITCFSQGGTTARVAKAIGEGFASKGHEVVFHAMAGKEPLNPDGFDLLGVGLPVYYFRPPFNVMDVLSQLPDLKGLPVFVFVLYGTRLGDVGTVIRTLLRDKGGRDMGLFTTKGEDYFLGYLKRGYLFSPEKPASEDLEHARVFGETMADRVERGDWISPEDDAPPPCVYRLERFLSNRWFTRWIYSRMFRVKKDRCTGCGLCMKLCPMGNITADENDRPVWGRDCLLCLYCEMKCPAEAIVSPLSTPLFAPFMAYNVWQARTDPTVNHARVVHEKGRVKRLETPGIDSVSTNDTA